MQELKLTNRSSTFTKDRKNSNSTTKSHAIEQREYSSQTETTNNKLITPPSYTHNHEQYNYNYNINDYNYNIINNNHHHQHPFINNKSTSKSDNTQNTQQTMSSSDLLQSHLKHPRHTIIEEPQQ